MPNTLVPAAAEGLPNPDAGGLADVFIIARFTLELTLVQKATILDMSDVLLAFDRVSRHQSPTSALTAARIEAHEGAYEALQMIGDRNAQALKEAHGTLDVSGYVEAATVEERALTALCACRCTTPAESGAKAGYLLGHLDRVDELNRGAVVALLRSMLPRLEALA